MRDIITGIIIGLLVLFAWNGAIWGQEIHETKPGVINFSDYTCQELAAMGYTVYCGEFTPEYYPRDFKSEPKDSDALLILRDVTEYQISVKLSDIIKALDKAIDLSSCQDGDSTTVWFDHLGSDPDDLRRRADILEKRQQDRRFIINVLDKLHRIVGE